MENVKLRSICKNLLVCFFLFSCLIVSAQNPRALTITGKVQNNLNQSLIGVSITNLTNQQTVSTNENGEYSITANQGDSLQYRYVGYKSLKQRVTTSIEINVVLEGEDNSLNEVVVVGYGQQRKMNMVGAQATVKVEDLKQPVANLSATLAGRIAGLVGVQRSGLPGSNSADVWIRGISTFNSQNSASPLIVVDGVQGRDLNAFDPEDIASLTILKDASSTAVYGAQGANGVILITTKKGRTGKPTLMFNYNQGMVNFTKTPELTNAEQYMRLRNEAMVASGLAPEYSQEYIDNTLNGTDPYLYPNVNWMDEIFKGASYNRRANFSARGGSESTQYYSSIAYYDESSLLNMDALQNYKADSRFRRYNFTSNIDMDWTKTTKFSLGIQGYITNTNYPNAQTDITATSNNSPAGGVQSIFGRVMQATPVLYPLMYPGNLVPAVNQSSDAQPNPYALATQTGYINNFRSQVYSNARISQQLDFVTKGLNAYAMFSFDTNNSHSIARHRMRNTYTVDRANPYLEDGSLNLVLLSNGSDDLGYRRTNNGTRQFYFEGGTNYNRQFGRHDVTGLLLYTQTDEVRAFATDLTASLPFRTQRIVGRANYLYDDRYAAEFNFAYDGSENFVPSRRFGFFPSFGVGWILSNEKFFESAKETFQMVKLRYSNGITGSGGGGRRFGFMTIVSTGATGYSFYDKSSSTNKGYGGVAISDYGYDVTWAESHKHDIGLEFTTLKGKLNVTVDWFKENRSGIFLQRASLPNYLGLQNQPFGNLGIIKNQGFDGTIALEGAQWGQTTWSFNGTFSYNKDQVIDNDNPTQLYPYLERRGRNFLANYGYVADGLFQSQGEIDNHADQSELGAQRVGDIRYKDLNGDGVINSYDQTKIGNGDVPNWVYGAGFNVSYKGFYFGAFFQGINGANRVLSGDGILPFNNSTGPERSNLYAMAESRWTPENPSEDVFYPRLGYGNSINKNNSVASTWWVKDIDFLRLKTVDLGYNLRGEKLKTIGVKSARIYAQGVNLLYWSKFKLWDPELNTGNGSSYPNTRTFSLGIQANF